MAEKFSSGLQLLNEMDEKPIAATAALLKRKYLVLSSTARSVEIVHSAQ